MNFARFCFTENPVYYGNSGYRTQNKKKEVRVFCTGKRSLGNFKPWSADCCLPPFAPWLCLGKTWALSDVVSRQRGQDGQDWLHAAAAYGVVAPESR